MAQFYRSSEVWVVDFTYDGHPRRWLKPLPRGVDARAQMESLLDDWYGPRARLLELRPATAEEETQYIRGELPRNAICPTGRAPARRS